MSIRNMVLASAFLLLCGSQAQAQTKYNPSGYGDLPVIDPQTVRASNEQQRLIQLADTQYKQQQWKKAISLYQQALQCLPGSAEAWYGLGKCYAKMGDAPNGLEAYRQAVYAPASSKGSNTDYPYRIGDVDRLMEFALLLSKSGQSDEAVTVYNYAINRLNYVDNKPNVKVLLPEFGLLSGQRTYQPLLLQAMAHTAIGLTLNEDKPAMEHLDEAVRLAPGSGLTHFYRGQTLRFTGGKPQEVKAEYEKARNLDPKAIGKAAAEELNSSSMRNLTP